VVVGFYEAGMISLFSLHSTQDYLCSKILSRESLFSPFPFPQGLDASSYAMLISLKTNLTDSSLTPTKIYMLLAN
jgi:hypothetical protein